jgi:hypothetical protein
MKKKKLFNSLPTASILIFAAAIAMSGNARAQVTIGADLEPQPFSILELISGNSMGLRLPQMTTAQRNEMVLTEEFQLEKTGKARGLQIFNTTTLCVETWNGAKWIEQCMDCSGVAAPVINSTFSACKVGESITFTATTDGDYRWQISSDGGGTWTDVSGTDSSNSIPFASAGDYLVHASAVVCKENFSNTLQVQALSNIVDMGDMSIMTLNNVMYSYQYAKLATYHTGTALGYQWYMKFAGYNVQGGNIPSTPPAVNEADDIIVGANQSSYTFDPYSDNKYQGAGTYYFYCKAFGKNSSNADIVSSDVILVRVEDLYDASRSNLLITKEQWKEDSITNEVPGGQLYFIPVLYGSSNASLKIAHANLGSAHTRDAGELGSLYQWARDEDGHEYRQYNGKYDNWDDLSNQTNTAGTETFVSPTYGTKASGQATGDAVGKFIANGYSYTNWTSTNYTSGWGIHTGTADPCKTRHSSNPAWRIPSGNGNGSDWVKLTLGTPSDNTTWSNNMVSGRTNQNTVLYRYLWGSRYGSIYYGSMTIVSNTSFADGKNYVAIIPASGYRYHNGGFSFAGKRGNYWSSTYSDDTYAYTMYFYSDNLVSAGYTNYYKAMGLCVRCVAE